MTHDVYDSSREPKYLVLAERYDPNLDAMVLQLVSVEDDELPAGVSAQLVAAVDRITCYVVPAVRFVPDNSGAGRWRNR